MLCDPLPPAQHTTAKKKKKKDTGHYRLVEYLQQPIAHIKRPELQKEQPTLTFPVEAFSVVQVVAKLLPQVLVGALITPS